MNTAPLYSRMLLIVMLLGITAYSAAAPALLLAIFAIPVGFFGWKLSVRTGAPARLPTFVVNTLLFAAVAFAVYRTTTHGFEVAYIAELVVFLQLIKLGDRRGPRDDAHILSLSVFLAIAAMLTSNTLWVGLLLAIFLPCLIAAIMLFQIHKGFVAAGLALPHSGAPRRRMQRETPEQLAIFNRHFRRTAALATVGTLIAAFVVFVIMPRGIGENAFGNWGAPQSRSVTGFTDRVNLGSRGVISTSPTIVMDLAVRESAGEDASLSLGSTETVHYLRGAVLDYYEGREWRPSRDDPSGHAKQYESNIDVRSGDEYSIAGVAGALLEQTITLRNTEGRRGRVRLFAVWRPVRIQVQRDSRLTLNLTDGIIERRAFDRNSGGGPLTYTVWSSTRDFPNSDPTQRTPTSFDSARVQDLASQIVRQAGIDPDPAVRPISDDSRAARAIQDYLRANFEYTLEEQYIPPEAHPIEHFLFSTRRGHCEYYASAMTAMCRSIGIYARIVTGYVAAEYNATSGHYTVRESNAHAWVEAEAGRNRWRRFDPTPQSDLVRLHRPAQTLLSRARQFFDAIEFAWNTSVVGFDAGQRERLLRTDRVRESSLVQRIDSMASNTSLGGARSATGLAARLALVFMGLALPATAGFLIWRWGRRLLPGSVRRRGRACQHPDAGIAFYRKYLDTLARRGHAKPAWRPPLLHAQKLPADGLAGPAIELARLYYQARFGGRPLSSEQLQQADGLIAALASPARKPQAENA